MWLSGGVDSGLIAGITAKELGVKMDTFSIIYPKTYNFFDESERAKIISKEFNHNHQELEINPVHIFDNFDEILYYQEEWIGNPASLLYYNLSKKTKEHVKVVLSGLGGDEVFGGYNRYRALEMASMLSTWPKTLKQLAKKIIGFLPQTRLNSLGNYGRALNKIFNALDTDDHNTYIRIISYWENNNVEQLVNLMEKTGDIMNDVMRFDIKNYMQDDLLLLSDKMSMAHGLELRVPLIDNKILEAAFSTNATNRMGRTGKKEFLTNWFKECIGDKLQQGRKMGFSIPVEPFLKKIGKEELNHLIKKSEIKEFVAQTTIDKILNEFFSQGKDHVNEIYALLVLAKWRITRNK